MSAPLIRSLSPALFLGGVAAAFLLNALAIARLDLSWEKHRLVSTVTIEPRPLNLALILGGGLLLAAFLAYGFVENYRIIETHL